MSDRQLAQKIELLLWKDGPYVNQKLLDELIALMNNTETAIQFYIELPKWVESKGITFSEMKSSDVYKCAMPGNPHIAIGKPLLNARGEIIE